MRDAGGEARLGCDRLSIAVLLVAIVVAVFSARPYAGAWNDGSRLAAVESLVDYHTWAIDRSIFVSQSSGGEALSPYPATLPALQKSGTQDKMWINGHFYSDKAPIPTLYLAALYAGIQFFTGMTARAQPHWFCYWMTLLSSGIAYVLSVWCIDRLAAVYRLPHRPRILVIASFALATIALPYARQVNSHVLLLGVCSVLLLVISRRRICSTRDLIIMGSLIGAGYTLDFAIGSFLVLATVGLTTASCRRWFAVILLLTAAFPWFALHHAINYRIAGTFLPANVHPEFFRWPGCPFSPQSLTGGWHHGNIFEFTGYAFELLIGTRGFLGHNLPLFLALTGAVSLVRRDIPEKNALCFAITLSTCSWLIYALGSNNHGGVCCSVRWFVPLLGPGFYALVLLLHYNPDVERQMAVLSLGGWVLGVYMWRQGPWMPHMVPGYWFIVAATCIAWIFYRFERFTPSRKS